MGDWEEYLDLFDYIQKINKEFGLIKTLDPLGFDFHEESKLKEKDKIWKGEITIIPKRKNNE